MPGQKKVTMGLRARQACSKMLATLLGPPETRARPPPPPPPRPPDRPHLPFGEILCPSGPVPHSDAKPSHPTKQSNADPSPGLRSVRFLHAIRNRIACAGCPKRANEDPMHGLTYWDKENITAIVSPSLDSLDCNCLVHCCKLQHSPFIELVKTKLSEPPLKMWK